MNQPWLRLHGAALWDMDREELTRFWEGLDPQFTGQFVLALIDEIHVCRMAAQSAIRDLVTLELSKA